MYSIICCKIVKNIPLGMFPYKSDFCFLRNAIIFCEHIRFSKAAMISFNYIQNKHTHSLIRELKQLFGKNLQGVNKGGKAFCINSLANESTVEGRIVWKSLINLFVTIPNISMILYQKIINENFLLFEITSCMYLTLSFHSPNSQHLSCPKS